MKYLKSTFYLVLVLFVALFSSPKASGQSNDSEGSAELRISTTKREYLLGEPVRLERLLVKIGDPDRVGFPGDDLQGSLRVFVAKGDGEFRRYMWGGYFPDREYTDGPGRLKVLRTIFFNKKPVTYHLSDYGRREAERGMILTDYAFPEPGEYRIKASRYYSVRRGTDRYASSSRAESNVISIWIREPVGEDLRVWEIMRGDPRIGFFMTDGEALVPGTRDELQAEVDRVVAEHPNSYLAGLLRKKAEENRARRTRTEQENERDRLHREREKAASVSRKN